MFSQLLWAWEQNEEEQRQERERAQSLYQIRSHLGEEPQEQAEEKERQALFPSYAEVRINTFASVTAVPRLKQTLGTIKTQVNPNVPKVKLFFTLDVYAPEESWQVYFT